MATMGDVYTILLKINDQIRVMLTNEEVDENVIEQLRIYGHRIMELVPQELGVSELFGLPGTTEIGPRAEEELCAVKMLLNIS